MAKYCKPKQTISAESILKTEMIINQALIDLLIDKQIITEKELMNSIQEIRREQQKLKNCYRVK